MIRALCDGFLNTPSLWEKNQFGIQQFEFPSLALPSFQPTYIPSNLRLGHQMEYVFKQLVDYSEAYSVLMHNLPISENGITKGEIDFVLQRRETGQFIHVELTYKFYLIDPDIPEPIHSFIGPNRRDTLFAKMEKIRNRQFPLIHSKAGIEALANKGIDHLQLSQQCCFKAQLFQPYMSTKINMAGLNKDCMAGYWLRSDDFEGSAFEQARFYIPTKSEWLLEPQTQVAWKTHTEALIEIQNHMADKMAPMLWIKWPDKGFEKMFVVWW